MAIEILSPDYIVPDNDIWLLKWIPLEPNYENTILWEIGQDYINGTTISNETKSAAQARQFAWFTNTTYHPCKHVTASTYQREGRKYCRVDYPIADLIGYNYIAFKNSGSYTEDNVTYNHYENKYYYGFITKLEYLNDRVTLVHYTIDVMQTFMFDYEVEPCLIDREHSTTDQIGDNTLNENLPTGQMIYYNKGNPYALRYWVVCVFVSEYYDDNTQTWYAVDGHRVGGVLDSDNAVMGGLYSGLRILTFNLDDNSLTSLNNTIKNYTNANKSDSIASICLFPRMLTGTSPFENPNLPSFDWQIDKDITWTYSYNGKAGPRNKKLYCYPFNKLTISNNNGDENDYKYELFNTGYYTVHFDIYASPYGNGEIMAIPLNYIMQNDTYAVPNYNERMCIKGLPQCAYTIDSYRAWVAQNRNQITGKQQQYVLGSLIQPLSMAQTGTANGSFMASLSNAFNVGATASDLLNKNFDMQTLSNILKGQDTPSLNLQQNILNFMAYNVRLKPEYACQIDDYFDFYGYACRRVKKPNINVRENWCYCKTIGCRLGIPQQGGGVTGDVDDKICSIYNNGVRFWKNPFNVGNYNLTNRCIADFVDIVPSEQQTSVGYYTVNNTSYNVTFHEERGSAKDRAYTIDLTQYIGRTVSVLISNPGVNSGRATGMMNNSEIADDYYKEQNATTTPWVFNITENYPILFCSIANYLNSPVTIKIM